MDIHYYLQHFESTVKNIIVEDPLEAWDKFVAYLDTTLPPEEKENMGVVMERLVQTFLEDQRYHHDPRFINHCIRYASHHSDPVSVFTQVHSVGVGTRAASLYTSWAQQCETRNLHIQAEQIYHQALENRAEPLDTLQQHYTLFKSRTERSHTPSVSAPLKDSQMVNQQLRQRDGLHPQCTAAGSSQCPGVKTVRIISRSENNPPTRNSVTECVSMYCVSELVCDGSELSFEELRAQRYFTKLKQHEMQRQQEEVIRRYEEEEVEVVRMKKLLEELNSKLTDVPQLQQETEETPYPYPAGQSEAVRAASVCDPVVTHHPDTSLSQRLQHTLTLTSHTHTHNRTHTEDPAAQSVCVRHEEQHAGAECHTPHDTRSELLVPEEPDGDVNSDVSHGVFSHHAHVTPNTSLGLISATPSRALPSPTVNTREALDLIGNMFQGPTLLQDSLFNTTHNTAPACEEDGFERNCRLTGVAPSSAPFRIYQDENNEIRRVDPQVVVKPKPTAHHGLMEIPVSKSNVTLQGAESLTDDSTMWGSGHTPLASFPNHTQDFALSAHLVSTPLHPLPPYCRDTQHIHEAGVDENPFLRQPAKLSPILEQSPPEEKEKQCAGEESTLRSQGTIMGECVSVQGHAHSLVHLGQSSISVSRPALASLHVLAPLRFPDQSITTSQDLRATIKPSWSVYQSPLGDIKPDGDLMSSSLDLVREPRADQAISKEHLNSNIPHKPDQLTSSSFTSHTHNPNKDLLADPRASRTELNSSRLHLFGEFGPEKLNSRSFMERNPDQDHLNHSQQSDVEEADVLLPEMSFNMHRSVSLLLENPQVHQRNSFMVPQSPDPMSRAGQDVPMSPEPAPGFGWLQVESPIQLSEPDLDVMVESPQQTSRPGWNVYLDQRSSSSSGILLPKRSFGRRKSEKTLQQGFNKCRSSDQVQDVPMCPAAELDWICLKSPVQEMEEDLEVMTTPQKNRKTSPRLSVLEMSLKLSCGDASPAPPSAPPTSSVLVSDPWDDEVITYLLAGLHPPLTSYPNLNIWSCSVPPIAPKLTVQMGDQCLRVDGMVGQGAFATVYQATELNTSHKLILKVQRPSSPWEFYMNTQLDWRVEPGARHLYQQLYAAHLYTNGSVLLGELHTCGTLLNVVNLYKCRSEKVMPHPLVLYFTVCILDMVEKLHTSNIIHADIKPDNFLLGERFLQNKNLSEEKMDHGLVLIDFGQSVDITLFPDGVQFTARCMTSGFQCTEMLSNKPWSYQTDYFGIAGTVYCMLFGSYMKVRNDGGVWRSGGVFKRKPHSELWQEFFHVLLNVPDHTSLPRLRVLRERVSAALLEHYSTKLLGLKNQLVVQILESRSSRR